MATTSEARALPFFTDLQGQPLSSGYIYIGQAGLDPVAYPAVVTSDIAGDVVIAQPIRTTNGHATAAGSQIHLFCDVPYSITILDSAKRLVYASLNENDPVALAVSSSSVQSAADLPSLRARSGSATNQVWVNNFGMYAFVPTDTTSPENIPFIIVGNDGSRYYLSMQSLNAEWLKVSAAAPFTAQGGYFSWNDDGNNTLTITNNPGGLTGGFRIRVTNASGTEVGVVTISSAGALATGSDITSGGSVTVSGQVNLNNPSTRSLKYNAGTNRYELPSSDLTVNGSLTMTQSTLANNQQFFGVGAIIMTNGSAPIQAGTWVLQVTGLGSSGLQQYVRTA